PLQPTLTAWHCSFVHRNVRLKPCLCNFLGEERVSWSHGLAGSIIPAGGLGFGKAPQGAVALSREILAKSHASHISPKSTVSSAEKAGASLLPALRAARAASCSPSCQRAIASTAQPFALANNCVLFTDLSPHLAASAKCPCRYSDKALHACK